MCRNEIIIMMERERVLSWPELCLTGSWPALDPFTLILVWYFSFDIVTNFSQLALI